MHSLGIDTCFGACSVAVIGPGGRVTSRMERMSTGHAERLLPMIDEVLTEAGIEMQDIERIAVTRGPGTFTGMRIGISAARALSLSISVPIVSFTSLEVMAHDPSLPNDRTILVAVDAHRGEIYTQLFAAKTRAPLSDPQLLTPDYGAALLGEQPVLAVGSGARLIAEAAAAKGHHLPIDFPELLPAIDNVLSIAASRTPMTSALKPLYLRPPDAKPQDGKSLARAIS